jgi:hypothetical protein
MKALKIIAGSLAAALAAAFLAGAVWAHNADIDSADYIVSNDVITAAGAAGGALFLVLAAWLIYLGVRPRRNRGLAAEAAPARPSRSPAA